MQEKFFDVDNVYALVYGYDMGMHQIRFGRKMKLFYRKDNQFYSIEDGKKFVGEVGEFNKEPQWGKFADVILNNGENAVFCCIVRRYYDRVDYQAPKMPIVLSEDTPKLRTITSDDGTISSQLKDLLKFQKEYNNAITKYFRYLQNYKMQNNTHEQENQILN